MEMTLTITGTPEELAGILASIGTSPKEPPQQIPQPDPEHMPEPAKTADLDPETVRAALVAAKKAGTDVAALLKAEFGATKFSSLDPGDYGRLMELLG